MRPTAVTEGLTGTRFLVDAAAVYRLTKLATDDGITQPARDRIIAAAYASVGRAEQVKHEAKVRWNQIDWNEGDWQTAAQEDEVPPKLATLMICPWCASVWIALGLVYLVRGHRWWPGMAEALAMSAAAGFLTKLQDR